MKVDITNIILVVVLTIVVAVIIVLWKRVSKLSQTLSASSTILAHGLNAFVNNDKDDLLPYLDQIATDHKLNRELLKNAPGIFLPQ